MPHLPAFPSLGVWHHLLLMCFLGWSRALHIFWVYPINALQPFKYNLANHLTMQRCISFQPNTSSCCSPRWSLPASSTHRSLWPTRSLCTWSNLWVLEAKDRALETQIPLGHPWFIVQLFPPLFFHSVIRFLRTGDVGTSLCPEPEHGKDYDRVTLTSTWWVPASASPLSCHPTS